MFDFATAYHAIRQKEGRMYTDEVLRELPNIAPTHPLHQEWMIRKATMDRLLEHLRGRPTPRRLLDLGCGNGWMSHHFARLPGTSVIGMDLNTAELEQARRTFAHLPQLEFQEANVFDPMPGTFEVITMGGSVQYFPDLRRLVARLRELLAPDGEIHIFDSPFYEEAERPHAKQRSQAYYASMGFPELAECYFQPSIPEMRALGGELLYNPHTFSRRLRRKLSRKVDSPFHWWRLT